VKRKLLAMILLLGFCSAVDSAQTSVPVDVDGLCGRLVSAEPVAQAGSANATSQQTKPLSRVRIRLFSPSTDCCALVTPVAELTTDRDGSFQFKKIDGGDYWVSAAIDSKEYKVLVRFVPGKKGSAHCSTFLYVFDKGQLQLRKTESTNAS
jgi:hypothetical protein